MEIKWYRNLKIGPHLIEFELLRAKILKPLPNLQTRQGEYAPPLVIIPHQNQALSPIYQNSLLFSQND